MSLQDKDRKKQEQRPLTGTHIAPKEHGTGCPCCSQEDDDADED